jgi:peptidoglycan/LPS O-acetylase OafA/YrhL
MLLNILIAAHIAAGLTALTSGAAAMLAPKRRGPHPRRGTIYLTALCALVATAIAIVVARPHTAYLLILGALALSAAGLGYAARRIRWHGWLRHHLTAMAISYITMLTAFYVDNGPRLPLWKLLPPITFWFLPAAIGMPLLVRALRRHPNSPAHPSAPTPPASQRPPVIHD